MTQNRSSRRGGLFLSGEAPLSRAQHMTRNRSFSWNWRALLLGSVVTLLLSIPLLLSCSQPPYVWASQIPAERAKPAAASKTINPGDTLAVTVSGQPQLSGQFVVGADGTVSIPDIGAVAVSGRSQPQAAKQLTRRIGTIIESPRVSVVLAIQRIDVSVLGEVRAPGKYQLKAGEGVVALIATAGGLTEFADSDSIYLIRASEPTRIRFRMRDLARGGPSATAFALRDGDLLLVE